MMGLLKMVSFMVEEYTTRHLITLGSMVNSTKVNVKKYRKVAKETIP